MVNRRRRPPLLLLAGLFAIASPAAAASPEAAGVSGKDAVLAQPGDCAVAKPYVPILLAGGGRIDKTYPAGEPTGLDVVAGNASDRMSPTDVAAPPISTPIGPPGAPGNPVTSCLVGNCGPTSKGGTIPVVEPPAVIGLPPGIPGVPGGKTP